MWIKIALAFSVLLNVGLGVMLWMIEERLHQRKQSNERMQKENDLLQSKLRRRHSPINLPR